MCIKREIEQVRERRGNVDSDFSEDTVRDYPEAEDFVIGSFSTCLRTIDSEIDGNSNFGCFSGIGNGAPVESVANSLGWLHCFAKKDARRLAFSVDVKARPVPV